jgi:hypothetical protein
VRAPVTPELADPVCPLAVLGGVGRGRVRRSGRRKGFEAGSERRREGAVHGRIIRPWTLAKSGSPKTRSAIAT